MWYAALWIGLGVFAAWLDAPALKARRCLREIVLYGLLLGGGTLITATFELELHDVRLIEMFYVLFEPLDRWVERL